MNKYRFTLELDVWGEDEAKGAEQIISRLGETAEHLKTIQLDAILKLIPPGSAPWGGLCGGTHVVLKDPPTLVSMGWRGFFSLSHLE